MRAPLPLSRASFISLAALFGGAAAFVAACADSLHLDPGGDAGKTTTTSGGTTSNTGGSGGGNTGGAAPVGCSSNQDCGYPNALCDTIAGTCVECLTFSDCAASKPGTVCSFGHCVCPGEDGGPALTYCPTTNSGHCVDTQTSSSDCGSCGKKCFGSCAAGACTDKWRPMATLGAPSARAEHVSVWAASASRMFVWGGRQGSTALSTGGVYDPVKDAWKPTTPVNAPSPRWGATAVWDDVENVVIVWGGSGPGGTPLGDGGIYNIAADTWTSIPADPMVGPRLRHTAVWATFTTAFNTPSGPSTHGMMIWGGDGPSSHLNDGAYFDPAPGKGVWTVLEGGGPSPRREHAAVWNSATNEMVIMGGYGGNALPDDYLGDSWAFDALKTGNTPWRDLASVFSPRARLTGVFGNPGLGMAYIIAFGGISTPSNQLADGSIYKSTMWSGIGSLPEGREAHTAVRMDMPTSRMIVFGGISGGTTLGTAWAYDVVGSMWAQLPTPPGTRAYHTAVTDGTTMMLVWGGESGGAALDTGLIFTP